MSVDIGETNILLDKLPEAVTVSGISYPIRTDYRRSIGFELLLQNRSLTPQNRFWRQLDMYYISDIPSDPAAAYEAILVFYSGGKNFNDKKHAASNSIVVSTPKPKRILDYKQDANYLYAAFLSQYGVDLADVEHLHWWKFCAMIAGLDEHQMMSKIMGWRAADLGKIRNRDERNRIRKLQAMFAIDEHLTREEIAAQAGSAFAGGGVSIDREKRPKLRRRKPEEKGT